MRPFSYEACRTEADAALGQLTLQPLPWTSLLVAEVSDADTVLATFEAPTPGALRALMLQSGLLSDPAAALGLGAETEFVWNSQTNGKTCA